MEEGCLGLGDRTLDDMLIRLSSQPKCDKTDERVNKIITGIDSFGEVIIQLYESLFENSPLYSYNADPV